MSTLSSARAGLLLAWLAIFATISLAQAAQIGPRITCCSSHGPDIGGWKPGEKPIPNKPLDGLKMAIHDTPAALGHAATDIWVAVKRPFVEICKFIRDPLAGLRRSAEEAYARAVADATALAYQIVKWLSIGFGTALAFSIGLAMGLAALLFRHRSGPKVDIG